MEKLLNINFILFVVIIMVVFIIYFFYKRNKTTKSSNEHLFNEKDNIEPSQWCYINKEDNTKYIVSIFYDNNDSTYRVVEMNSDFIFENKFFCSEDAKRFIKEQAKDGYIVGLKIYKNL